MAKPSVYHINVSQGDDKYSWAAAVVDAAVEPQTTKTIMGKSLPEVMAKLLTGMVVYDEQKKAMPEQPLIVPAKEMPKAASN